MTILCNCFSFSHLLFWFSKLTIPKIFAVYTKAKKDLGTFNQASYSGLESRLRLPMGLGSLGYLAHRYGPFFLSWDKCHGLSPATGDYVYDEDVEQIGLRALFFLRTINIKDFLFFYYNRRYGSLLIAQKINNNTSSSNHRRLFKYYNSFK